jgi:hypothetical protein
MGVDAVRLRNLYPLGVPGHSKAECLKESDAQALDFIAALRHQRHRVPVFPPRLYQSSYNSGRCLLPFQKLSVGGDGSIGPCCVVGPDRKWGSFLDPDVWNGWTMTATRQNMRDGDTWLQLGCSYCEEMLPKESDI